MVDEAADDGLPSGAARREDPGGGLAGGRSEGRYRLSDAMSSPNAINYANLFFGT